MVYSVGYICYVKQHHRCALLFCLVCLHAEILDSSGKHRRDKCSIGYTQRYIYQAFRTTTSVLSLKPDLFLAFFFYLKPVLFCVSQEDRISKCGNHWPGDTPMTSPCAGILAVDGSSLCEPNGCLVYIATWHANTSCIFSRHDSGNLHIVKHVCCYRHRGRTRTYSFAFREQDV